MQPEHMAAKRAVRHSPLIPHVLPPSGPIDNAARWAWIDQAHAMLRAGCHPDGRAFDPLTDGLLRGFIVRQLKALAARDDRGSAGGRNGGGSMSAPDRTAVLIHDMHRRNSDLNGQCSIYLDALMIAARAETLADAKSAAERAIDMVINLMREPGEDLRPAVGVITILRLEGGTLEVSVDGRTTGQLSWDEALGHVAEMIHPRLGTNRFVMQTPAEWQAQRDQRQANRLTPAEEAVEAADEEVAF